MKRAYVWGLVGLGAAAQLVAQVVLVARERWFASEDDGYRLYQAYLMCSGQADPVGRFWLPGTFVLECPFLRAGAPPVWAGIGVSIVALLALSAGLAALARRLAPPEQRAGVGAAAFVLVMASPMATTLSHSSLAELPASAACVAAALALVARAQGASRWVLAGGALAMVAATWMRYECWILAAVYPLAVAWAAWRGGSGGGEGRGGSRRVKAAVDGAIAALAWAGPFAWMALQARAFGDPFAFVRATAEISEQGGHPGVLAVLGNRAYALALWAPAVLVWAVFARRAPFGDRPARAVAIAFFVWMALGVVGPALAGDEHPVFPDRLAFALEVGLVPLAALAWRSWRDERAGAARARAPEAPEARRLPETIVALVTVAPLGILLAVRAPAYLDADSVELGRDLRAGRVVVPDGTRVWIERPEQRPPLGWASVASAWGAWSRVIFATPEPGGGWELVAPTDVRGGRAKVTDDALPAWLDAHAVASAWCVSRACGDRLRMAWPGARVSARGGGMWIER